MYQDNPAIIIMRKAKTMLPEHVKVLHCYAEARDEDGDFCFVAFATVSKRTGMDRQRVRYISRHLKRKGWLTFEKGLWREDGGMAGSGYAITDLGHALSELIKAKQEEKQ